MSNLKNSIKSLYAQITEEEAAIAESNLLSFFKVLEKVEARISIKNQAQKIQQKCNELKNENLRSTNRVHQAK
jgi:hypothetical protein